MLNSAVATLVVVLIFLLEVVQNHLQKLLGLLYLGGATVAFVLAFLYVFLAVRARIAIERARGIG